MKLISIGRLVVFFVVVFFLPISLYSKIPVYAINISYSQSMAEIEFAGDLMRDIIKLKHPSLVVYNWDIKQHKLSAVAGIEEKPAEYAVFIKLTSVIPSHNRRSVGMQRLPKSQRSTSLNLVMEMRYDVKVINVKTGCIEKLFSIHSGVGIPHSEKTHYIIVDVNRFLKERRPYVHPEDEVYRISAKEIRAERNALMRKHMVMNDKLIRMIMEMLKNQEQDSSIVDKEKINIAISSLDCFFCEAELQKEFITSPVVNLIERYGTDELDQLRALYRDERFITNNIAELQDKQYGVQYLLSFRGYNMAVTDVKTGQLVATDDVTGVYKFARGFANSGYRKMTMLHLTGSVIEFVRITREKKKKALEVELFHPFGLRRPERFDLFTVQVENVNGKKIERKSFIASGIIVSSGRTRFHGILKVFDGKKELFKAVESGAKIVANYSIRERD